MKTLIVISAVSLASLTVGCTVQDGGTQLVGNVVVVDRTGMLREYHALADHYRWPLPEGVSFPQTLPSPPEETVYEVGEGRNQADSFWICSWMGAWITADSREDEVGARRAWAWLERADETQLHIEHYDDPTDIWHREILGPAQAGDPRPIHEFYATSCGLPGLSPLRALIRRRS